MDRGIRMVLKFERLFWGVVGGCDLPVTLADTYHIMNQKRLEAAK